MLILATYIGLTYHTPELNKMFKHSPPSSGYYAPSQDVVYTEESPGGDYDFLSRLCVDWEAAADLPPEANVRTAKIRTGKTNTCFMMPLEGQTLWDCEIRLFGVNWDWIFITYSFICEHVINRNMLIWIYLAIIMFIFIYYTINCK